MRTKFGVTIVFGLVLAVALPAGTMAQSYGGAVRQSPAAAPSSDQPQITQPEQGGVNWQGVGVGAGTLATNVVYIPAKLVYGLLGGIAGGAGYALTGGNQQVANTIWRSSLGGDYVVTPDMLTGKQPVHFSGPTQTEPTTGPSANAAAPGAASASTSAGTGPAVTSSARPSSSFTSPSTMAAAPTHPIDTGAGPIGSTLSSTSISSSGSGSISGSPSASSINSSTAAKSPAKKSAPIPDTSIE